MNALKPLGCLLVCSVVLLSSSDAFSKPRPPLPPYPEWTLNLWRFDQTNWWTDARTGASAMQGVSLIESWSGYAVVVPRTAELRFPAVNATGGINLCLDEGSLRFWIARGTAESGSGVSPLIEAGVWSAGATIGAWGLYLSGTELIFSSQGGGVTRDYLSAPVNWPVGEWHQIALSYDANATALYIDGTLVAQGSGICCLPSAEVFALTGFGLGGDCAFDELTTFAYPLSAEEIARNYSAIAPQAALGPVTPEEEAAWQLMIAQAMAPQLTGVSSFDGGATTMSGPMPGGGGGGGGGITNGPMQGVAGPGLKLRITYLTTNTARMEILEDDPQVTYDLIYSPTINLPVTWQWYQEIPPPTNSFIIPATNITRFFRLKAIPDLDGDGQRDYWEWGGTPPAQVAIDNDSDNDGIPNEIERAWGSSTNDVDSLPPATFYVDRTATPGGDGSLDLPFQSIQPALNAATNFAVILVKPGLYNTPNDYNLSFRSTNLVLISEKGWEQTIINCADATNRAFTFTSTNENYRARVSGFTITNAGGPAVFCSGGSAPMFVNCTFRSNPGRAVETTNSSPTFINCRFLLNRGPTAGTAVYARGSNSTVRLSHCTLLDNTNASFAQIGVQAGGNVTVNNSIIWRSGAAGTEISTFGGTVTATYCNIRGGFPGDGNINSDPLFEGGATGRLQVESPCIDRGVTNAVPGFGLFTRFDMDGETRLDRIGFTNYYSTTDIGADEFVYRVQFPLDPNGFSEVDEASGVVNMGTNSFGWAPMIAIIDDEDRVQFHVYFLNNTGTGVDFASPVSVRNGSYTNEAAGENEQSDMEGLTFNPSTRQLYIITSQTKRNRYRDVDNIDTDPVNDAPSNDYDRRRSTLLRFTMNEDLAQADVREFFESENITVPYSVGHDATNGLIPFIRQALSTNTALVARPITNRVLLAWNSVNKFGTPSNGVSYPGGALLPYTSGGPSTTAGISLGEGIGTTGLSTHTVLSNTWNYYKIWAIDANTNYRAGPVASARTDGLPRLFVNELLATGTADDVDPDWIEIYNPAHVPMNVSGLEIADNGVNFVPMPNVTVPGRGFQRFRADNNGSGGFHLNFALSREGENIVIRRASDQIQIDQYRFGHQGDNGNNITEGRAWDAGPRGFVSASIPCKGARFRLGSTYEPTRLITQGDPTNNHALNVKRLMVTPDVLGTTNYLEWNNVGALPAVWRYSPKQHDFHAINIEDFAYRANTQMVIGLRAPLSNRTNGNAYYFMVTNVNTFLPATGWTYTQAQGITGPFQMNLDGLGFRGIKWCPEGLTNSSGTQVARYLILAGSANGGPLQREKTRQRFAVYSWTGNTTDAPHTLIADLNGYAVRPEGVDLIVVGGQRRIFFVEDRLRATGYATRNAISWPVTILGPVP